MGPPTFRLRTSLTPRPQPHRAQSAPRREDGSRKRVVVSAAGPTGRSASASRSACGYHPPVRRQRPRARETCGPAPTGRVPNTARPTPVPVIHPPRPTCRSDERATPLQSVPRARRAPSRGMRPPAVAPHALPRPGATGTPTLCLVSPCRAKYTGMAATVAGGIAGLRVGVMPPNAARDRGSAPPERSWGPCARACPRGGPSIAGRADATCRAVTPRMAGYRGAGVRRSRRARRGDHRGHRPRHRGASARSRFVSAWPGCPPHPAWVSGGGRARGCQAPTSDRPNSPVGRSSGGVGCRFAAALPRTLADFRRRLVGDGDGARAGARGGYAGSGSPLRARRRMASRSAAGRGGAKR